MRRITTQTARDGAAQQTGRIGRGMGRRDGTEEGSGAARGARRDRKVMVSSASHLTPHNANCRVGRGMELAG